MVVKREKASVASWISANAKNPLSARVLTELFFLSHFLVRQRARDLTAAVDALRQEKLPKEQSDDDLESKEAAAPAPATATTGADNSSVSCFWRPLTDQNSTLFSLVFLIRR